MERSSEAKRKRLKKDICRKITEKDRASPPFKFWDDIDYRGDTKRRVVKRSANAIAGADPAENDSGSMHQDKTEGRYRKVRRGVRDVAT